MKKSILLIVIIIGLNTTLQAQNINLDKTALETVLCKERAIAYAQVNGMKIKRLPGVTNSNITFKPKGIYTIKDENGKKYMGNWIYDTKNKYVELSINGTITSRIKTINNKELVLILIGGQNEPNLSDIQVFYKPIKI